MKLKDRISGFLGRNAKEKSISLNGGYYGFGLSTGVDDPLLVAMRECGVNTLLDENPRYMLEFNRILWSAIPFFGRSVSIKNILRGTMQIEADNEQLEEYLQGLVDELPVYHSHIQNTPKAYGLDALNDSMRVASSRDGESFAEIVYGDASQRGFKGIAVHDAGYFEYVQEPGTLRNFQLAYNSETGQNVIEGSANWIQQSYKLDERFLWSPSMLHGARFLADIVVRIIIARKNLHMMKGNPPVINLLSGEDERLGADERLQKLFKLSADKMKDAYNTAMKNMYKGKATDLWMHIPFKSKLDQSTYGDGVQGIQQSKEELEFYMAQLAQVCDLPAMNLGFRSTGGGLQSREFEVALTLMKAKALEDQRARESENKRILQTIATSEGIDIEGRYSCSWEAPDLDDEKVREETRKLYTESVEKSISNINQILNTAVNPGPMIEEYADTVEMPWLAGDFKEPTDPEPMPGDGEGNI